MKIYVLIFLAIFVNSIWCDFSKEQIVTVTQDGAGGFWKSNKKWKAHWVKEWQIRKIYVPVWRKVWAPVDVKEWIPFPKPLKPLIH